MEMEIVKVLLIIANSHETIQNLNIKIKDINIEGNFRGGNINLALSPLAKKHVNHVQDIRELKYDLVKSEVFIFVHYIMYKKAIKN